MYARRGETALGATAEARTETFLAAVSVVAYQAFLVECDVR
jgi:hypothetical protein